MNACRDPDVTVTGCKKYITDGSIDYCVECTDSSQVPVEGNCTAR